MALVKFTRPQPRAIYAPTANRFPMFPAFEDMEGRMNKFIERMFNEPFATPVPAVTLGWIPPIDIVESEKELTLTAELPGIEPKDVKVSIEDGLLTISGEKKEERKEEEEDKKVYLYERSYGSFQRSFALPPNVDASNIAAEFDKAVLRVHLPKTAESKPKGRTVEIKNG